MTGQPRGAWTAICGTSAAASIGLALLVLGTVFISMAIPRESLGLRTAALRRSLAAAPATGTSVIGITDLATYTTGLDGSFITARHLAESRADLTASLAGARLPLLRPLSWSSYSTGPNLVVQGAGPRSVIAGIPPKMELVYRDQLSRYSRVVRGHLPAGRTGGHRAVQIAVTGATAARFGLRPGSRLNVSGVAVLVTGIIEPADPGSAFWTVDPVAAVPALNNPLPRPREPPPQWVGGAFVSPAGLPLLQGRGPPPRPTPH